MFFVVYGSRQNFVRFLELTLEQQRFTVHYIKLELLRAKTLSNRIISASNVNQHFDGIHYKHIFIDRDFLRALAPETSLEAFFLQRLLQIPYRLEDFILVINVISLITPIYLAGKHALYDFPILRLNCLFKLKNLIYSSCPLSYSPAKSK